MAGSAQVPKKRGAHLVELANDKSRQGRALLTTAIVEIFSDDARFFTSSDQTVMTDIIIDLVASVETSVKTALAERLSDIPDVPRDLARHFANQESNVAFPILKNSSVLRDPDLIEIVLHKTMEHQMAVSMRAMIPESVSNALAKSEHDEVVKSLLQNSGARIDDETFDGLAGRANPKTHFNQALVDRKDLPKSVASKLYWAVSAALRQELVSNFDLDSDSLDDAMEDIIPTIISSIQSGGDDDETDVPATIASAMRKGVLGEIFLTLLQSADVSRFTTWLSAASHLRDDLVRKIMFEEGGECLAAIFKAMDINRADFLEIFVLLRQGRLGEKRVPDKEVELVAEFFSSVEPERAANLLKRLQRNPEYLDAMRKLDITRH